MKSLDQIAIEEKTDKSSLIHNYCKKYELYFNSIRFENLKVLEIGVQNGFSLKTWARHNVSNGYWATGDIYTRDFKYLDRNNNLFSYEECRKEALDWYYKNNITIPK